MTTRGAYGFRINGADKVTYLPTDSEPTSFGLKIVDFVGSAPKAWFVQFAASLTLVDFDAHPTREQAQDYRKYVEPSATAQSDGSTWQALLHPVRGDLKALVRGLRYMVDEHKVLLDSIVCEWAYIVDVDEDTLEIYRGFQKHLGSGRYNHKMHEHPDFTGVALLQAIPMAVFRALSKEDGRHLMEAIHTLCLHAEGKLSAALEDEEFDRAKTVFKRLMAVDIALNRLRGDMPDHDFLHQTEESTPNADDLLREVYGHKDALPSHLARKLEIFFSSRG